MIIELRVVKVDSRKVYCPFYEALLVAAGARKVEARMQIF